MKFAIGSGFLYLYSSSRLVGFHLLVLHFSLLFIGLIPDAGTYGVWGRYGVGTGEVRPSYGLGTGLVRTYPQGVGRLQATCRQGAGKEHGRQLQETRNVE